MKLRNLLLAGLLLLCFWYSVSRVGERRQAEGLAQLDAAVRRTAAACYACEGFYPPSVEYMQLHYGLQYDEDAYWIHYEAFASNIMPDITVLERSP